MSENGNVIRFCPEPTYIVAFLDDGEVQINEKYTTTEAAREFWNLVKDTAFEAWSNRARRGGSDFNYDMTTAPKDGTPIWAASRTSDQVIRTYWAKTKTGGYWTGFKSDGTCDPVAWQPYVVPAHPGAAEQAMSIDTLDHEFMAALDSVGGEA